MKSKLFKQTMNAFMRTESIDIYNKALRSKLETNIKNNRFIISSLSDKMVSRNNLSRHIDDPFMLSKIDEKTDMQKLIELHFPYYIKLGSFTYTCSCGSGKTLAGVSLIHYLQCKTLIISSRCSINDQWKCTIKSIYPDLKIVLASDDKKSLNDDDVDIWIITPQYLISHLDIRIKPSLIIYDEIHTLLSEEYIKVLLLPFQMVIDKRLNELPFILGLSATYQMDSLSKNIIGTIFGGIHRSKSKITSIPITVYDFRDYCKESHPNDTFDRYYNPPSDIEFIKIISDNIEKRKYIKKSPMNGVKNGVMNGVKKSVKDCMKRDYDVDINFDLKFKGIIMTYTISSSIYSALYIHHRFKVNVLIVRDISERSIYLPADKFQDYKLSTYVMPSPTDLSKNKIGEFILTKDLQTYIEKSHVIVGTVQRLGAGFSVQNIVWGICTKFVYSVISRAQILGRIRRMSTDEELNNFPRKFYVCSGKIKSNLLVPHRKGPAKITYEIEDENKKFLEENYNRFNYRV